MPPHAYTPDLPKVALIGRPNVGKSSLFNRFVGTHKAITHDTAGTTRDKVDAVVTFGRGASALLMDVGGIETSLGTTLDADIQKQVRVALEESDLIIFIVDAKSELTEDDYAALDLLRIAKKDIIFLANKWEKGGESALYEFTKLGLGIPLGISALLGTNITEATEQIARAVRRIAKEKKYTGEKPEAHANIVLLGRPNVGKSSLLNALVGYERVVVDAVAGTTRDSADTYIDMHGKLYRFLDTAGLKRRGRIGKDLDYFATGRSLNSLEHADIALLMLDGTEGITAQDQHIFSYCEKAGVSVVLVINKADTWEEYSVSKDAWLDSLMKEFNFALHVPAIVLSAKTGMHVTHIFDVINRLLPERERRIPTPVLNRFIQRTAAEHAPTSRGTSLTPPRIQYGTQTGVKPPEFTFFLNRPQSLHFSYKRFLENRLREDYGFSGTPIRLKFLDKRGEKERAEHEAKKRRFAKKRDGSAPRGKRR